MKMLCGGHGRKNVPRSACDYDVECSCAPSLAPSLSSSESSAATMGTRIISSFPLHLRGHSYGSCLSISPVNASDELYRGLEPN